MNKSILTVFCVFLLLCQGCSTMIPTDCAWRQKEIIIDGDGEDWAGNKIMIEGKDLVVGTLNDQDYFYLNLTPMTRQLRHQMMIQGLTVWFDHKGEKNKISGIKYPIGILPEIGKAPQPASQSEMTDFKDKFLEMSNQVEIYQPGSTEAKLMTMDRLTNIQLIMKEAKGVITYEMKIPLLRDDQNPFGLNIKPGQVFGLGIEIPKSDREMRPPKGEFQEEGGFPDDEMGGPPPGGGMHGGHEGGIPEGEGRGGMRRSHENFQGLNIWLKVNLSQPTP